MSSRGVDASYYYQEHFVELEILSSRLVSNHVLIRRFNICSWSSLSLTGHECIIVIAHTLIIIISTVSLLRSVRKSEPFASDGLLTVSARRNYYVGCVAV